MYGNIRIFVRKCKTINTKRSGEMMDVMLSVEQNFYYYETSFIRRENQYRFCRLFLVKTIEK